jgi:hypothetical protein
MSVALMMEAARTSETLVDIQLRTQQYIPVDSELHVQPHLYILLMRTETLENGRI